MEEMEIVGTQENQESAQADAAQAPEGGTAALSDMLGEAEGAQAQADAPQEAGKAQQTEEPKVSGGIKGRLLDAERKGEKRGYDAGRQAARQEYEARLSQLESRLMRLDEYELREEAAKLAKEENISEAIAMRLLRAERGLKPAAGENRPEEKQERARDSAGRFVARREDDAAPDVESRARFLFAQAQSILRRTGMDALNLYKQADSQTQGRIARGEIDLEDLIAAHTAQPRTPPVVKASGGGPAGKRLHEMTADDFEKLDDFVKQGGVIDLRK